MGGGVNVAATSDKFGTGAQQVVQYTLVDYNGDILIVNRHNVTKLDLYGNEVIKDIFKPHKMTTVILSLNI